MKFNVRRQADGSIELLDLFNCLTPVQLKFGIERLKEEPVLSKEKNLRLIDILTQMANKKEIKEVIAEVDHFSPEFATHILRVLKELISYEKSMM